MLQCSPETPEQPSVTLLANLPSLKFHVDELKVKGMLLCTLALFFLFFILFIFLVLFFVIVCCCCCCYCCCFCFVLFLFFCPAVSAFHHHILILAHNKKYETHFFPTNGQGMRLATRLTVEDIFDASVLPNYSPIVISQVFF